MVPLLHLCALEFRGADAAAFLQNQLTNDVAELAPLHWQRGAYCNVKGRVLANFLLLRDAQSYTMILSASLGEAIRAQLQKFVLRMQVTLQHRDVVLFGVVGPDAARIALSHWGDHTALEQGGVYVMGATQCLCLAPGSLVAIVESAHACAAWQSLAARLQPAGCDAWLAQEIERDIPLVTHATQAMFLPQMLGLDRLGAVSFRKGCFPGQEIVARARYLGEVKRHLWRGVAALGAVAVEAQPVFGAAAGTESVGIVINAALLANGNCMILAVINDAKDSPRELFLDAADGTRVRLRDQAEMARA